MINVFLAIGVFIVTGVVCITENAVVKACFLSRDFLSA